MPNGRSSFVVVANRLPVDRVSDADGDATWRRSPGGLVTALRAGLRRPRRRLGRLGRRAGRGRRSRSSPTGMQLRAGAAVASDEVERLLRGLLQRHAVAALPRRGRAARVPPRAGGRPTCGSTGGSPRPPPRSPTQGAVVWVQDYQLQLVPAMLRELRPDLRIGFFLHIPFPPTELFMQLPWRGRDPRGLLGADLVGFQRPAARTTSSGWPGSCSACETQRRPRSTLRRPRRCGAGVPDLHRRRRDATTLAARPRGAGARRARSAHDLGDPDDAPPRRRPARLHQGHRAAAAGVRRAARRRRGSRSDDAVLVQVATPSRERVEQYRDLRDEIERLGRPDQRRVRPGRRAGRSTTCTSRTAARRLAALYRAADVMVVTPLRDGMNLVAKEYVAARGDDDGRAGAQRVRRRGRRAAAGVPGQPARHRRPEGRPCCDAMSADAGRPGRPDDGDAHPPGRARRERVGGELPEGAA